MGTVVVFAYMVLVLLAYDGKPVFDWHGITLNTAVSIFSSAGKASLMFIVAEAIGQWRWILFTRKSRPLLDLTTLDDVTRGPLGSLGLL